MSCSNPDCRKLGCSTEPEPTPTGTGTGTGTGTQR
jgi:hypothetical protein